jgi:hypothetical protein
LLRNKAETINEDKMRIKTARNRGKEKFFSKRKREIRNLSAPPRRRDNARSASSLNEE